jgi:hypothetical protein
LIPCLDETPSSWYPSLVHPRPACCSAACGDTGPRQKTPRSSVLPQNPRVLSALIHRIRILKRQLNRSSSFPPSCSSVHSQSQCRGISPGFTRRTNFSFYGQLPWESMKECIECSASSMLFLLRYGCRPGIKVEKSGWHLRQRRAVCWRDHSCIRPRVTSLRRGQNAAKHLVTNCGGHSVKGELCARRGSLP